MADDWSNRELPPPPVPPQPPSDRWFGCGCPVDAGECRHIRRDRITTTIGVFVVLAGAALVGAWVGTR